MPAEDAIEHLIALQAQEPFDPYTALWSRLEGFRAEELADLLIGSPGRSRRRDDADDDPPPDGATTGWRFGRSSRSCSSAASRRAARSVAISSASTLHEVVAAGRGAARRAAPGRQRGRARRSPERWPDRDAASLGYAVRYLLPLVQLPPRGIWGKSGRPVLATAENWLGRSVGTDTHPDAMILRYLAAYGPASVMDIQAWCWLTRLGPIVERLRPQLRTFRDENGKELFDVPDGPLPDPDTPAPPRFLPTYDNLVLSHKDRSRIIGDPSEWAVDGGQFDQIFLRGSVLVDGFVHSGWRVDRDGDQGDARRHARPAVRTGPARGRRRRG